MAALGRDCLPATLQRGARDNGAGLSTPERKCIGGPE
jgi:hypothetical protein